MSQRLQNGWPALPQVIMGPEAVMAKTGRANKIKADAVMKIFIKNLNIDYKIFKFRNYCLEDERILPKINVNSCASCHNFPISSFLSGTHLTIIRNQCLV